MTIPGYTKYNMYHFDTHRDAVIYKEEERKNIML